MGQPLDSTQREAAPLPSLATLLQQRWGDDWLGGLDSQDFWQQLDYVAQVLGKIREDWGYPPGLGPHPKSLSPRERDFDLESLPALLIVEPEPLRCLVGVLAGHWLGYTVVLANPQWGDRDWQQVNAITQPDYRQPLIPPTSNAPLSGGEGPGVRAIKSQPPWAIYPAWGLPPTPQPEILIATGGTSGSIKFARHTWSTLMASVQGFLTHFGTPTINAYCVLPLFHVSGLLQALRVLASGGHLIVQPYATLKQGHILPWPSPHCAPPHHPTTPPFLSLVPTQLQWLLHQGDPFLPWLQSFRAVLLGGAPPWPTLLAQARALHIPLALTYGMTETASQVATLLPEEFLAGNTSSGKVLPHATIHVLDDQGQALLPGQRGLIAIAAPSLFLGYRSTSPQEDSLSAGRFLTDDVGYLDEAGYLHLLGRQSSKIITGGEKVFPAAVEAALLATGQIQDTCVVGLPDRQWGQVVCALVVAAADGINLPDVATCLQAQLAPYQRPKRWILVSAIPRTAQGKVDRHQVLTLAQVILVGPTEAGNQSDDILSRKFPR